MIIGIDLGTTHSLAAIWRNGQSELIPNSLGAVLTPSAVGVDADKSILIGQAARERLQTHPEMTVAGFKRSMGTAKTFMLGSRRFRAEELSSLVLRSLKQDAEAYLGESVTQAVVTVPAYFSDAQRQATRAAGLLAGFIQIDLLNEPTAAALAYGMHHRDLETQFLVFDLGGGTFDVSVLEMFDGVMEVKATAGDNHLGGDDVDSALIQLFLQTTKCPKTILDDATILARLTARVEQAKRRLAQLESAAISLTVGTSVFSMELTHDQVASAIAPLLDRLRTPIERAMRDAKLRAEDLNAVVLAGGSTRLRAVRQLATKLFGRFPETALNPDEVVALGAAVQCGLKVKDAALAEHVMTDVCPYTLGIETSKMVSSQQFAGGFMTAVMERNTVIPASRVRRFAPTTDFQSTLDVNVYQGEARRVSDNIKLGQISLQLPRGKTSEVGADVRFTYDASGLLEVQVTPIKNDAPFGEPRQLVIESSGQRLTQEEIAQRLAALSELKIHPRDRMEIRTLLARAERHHGQLLGNARDYLAGVITNFEWALETQDSKKIAPAQEKLQTLLESIEADRFLMDDPL